MEALKRNIISKQELAVLGNLHDRLRGNKEQPSSEINQISVETGIRDSDEVLRALYTLEGKNFVSPVPAGSFTSNVWQITDTGIKAMTLVGQVR